MRYGLGGEVGLNYTIVGDDDEEDDQDVSASMLATTTELRVRWYLK